MPGSWQSWDSLAARRQQAEAAGVARTQEEEHDGGGGFNFHIPNLGGIKFFQQLGQGLFHLPFAAYSALPGGPKSELPQMARGFGTALGDVAATATKPFGIPGTDWSVADKIVEPLTEKLTGTKSQDLYEMSRHQGILRALGNQIGTVAAFAAPVAGIAGGTAKAAVAGEIGAAEALAAGTGTAEALATATAASTRAAQIANVAHDFAHPYVWAGKQFGGLTKAAREAGYTADIAAGAEAANGPTTLSAVESPVESANPELFKQMHEALNPERAAEAATTAEKPVDPYAHLNDLAQRAAESQSTVKTAGEAVPVEPGFVRLYNGGENAREMWTADRARAESYRRAFGTTADGGLRHIDVPEAEAQLYKTEAGSEAHQRALARGDQPNTATDYHIPAESLAAHEATAHEYGPAEAVTPDEPQLAEPTVGPHSKVSDRPQERLSPEAEAKAAREGELGEAAQRAQEGPQGARESSVAASTAERINLPPPRWAKSLVDRLPPSANRVLANLPGSARMEHWRLHNVVRDYERLSEAAHRSAARSPAVAASKEAARVVLDAIPEMDSVRASHIIGEDVGAALDGTAWVEEHIKRGGHPVFETRLRDIARRNYRGLTDEMKARMSPEQIGAYNAAIEDAVVKWREQSGIRLDTLLAGRKGAQGIEAAVLGEVGPVMTPKQKRDFKRATVAMRRQALREARGSSLREVQGANLARDRALLDERSTADAANARRKVGVEIRTMDDARMGVPKSLDATHIEGTIDALQAAVINSDGATWDVGRAVPTDGQGFAVAIGHQFDIPIEQYMTPEGRAMLKDAMESPKGTDGNVLGPGVWNGPDAKLGVWKHVVSEGEHAGETFVAVDVTLNSWGGEPLERWRAEALGEAYKQEELYDPTNPHENIALSGAESTQNLYAHFLPQILDERSAYTRVARDMEKVAVEAGIPRDAVSAEMRVLMTMDYDLARAHPETHTLGDYFKQAQIEFAKGAPSKYGFLAQTVAHVMLGDEITHLESLDAKTLQEGLSWYYDSHDYIESTYRGKPMTMLDGSVRDSAEVFYDLLAVTSVQASPTQNFGRALMALSNMDDLLKGHKGAALIAQDLMDRLEKTPNDSRVLMDVGQETERLATAEEIARGKGTKLSRRFLNPKVRPLLDQTAMTNKPKYNVFDVISGRLKLDGDLTAADLESAAKWWDVDKSISPASLARTNVTKWLDLHDVHTPEADAYREWVPRRDRIVGYHEQINALKKANPEMSKADIARDVLADNTDGIGNQAQLTRARKTVLAEEAPLLKAPDVRRSYEAALMEHQGSSALAKLRSFRSNLSAPAESLAVTLDSVMGKMWGFNSQSWDKVGFYSQYADRVRAMATELSKKWGRTVQPHEVQAALWVMTKRKIGQSDWGRWLAHHDGAHEWIDTAEAHVKGGGGIDFPETYDPFAVAWDEELGYSRHALDVRQEKSYLKKLVKKGQATPDEIARLAEISTEDVTSARSETVRTVTDKGRLNPEADITQGKQAEVDLADETRWSMPYDANQLTAKEEQYAKYVEVRGKMRDALAAEDFDEVRKLVTEYGLSRRKSIMGSSTGGSFAVTAEEQLNMPDVSAAAAIEDNSTKIAWRRLQNAKAAPAPRAWKSNFISSVIARWNREHGLPAPEPIDTLAEIDPAKTEAVAGAVQDLLDRAARGEITPGEDAAAAESYAALKQHVDDFYAHMVNDLGVKIDYVAPEHEYGLGTLGDDAQPDVALAHAELVHDVRANNHLKIRSTELAGDGPNAPMAEISPVHGIMYNNLLRAVHDFVGHAQAANDFGRNGENIAQMLHLQAVDEAAKPALITEFRAQTAYLVQTGNFMEEQLAHLLPEEMQGSHYMLHDDVQGLAQKNGADLRGLLMENPTKEGRLVMRMFKGADLSTLMHESAHLLRRILPDDSMTFVEGQYPHISDATLTPARVAAEEKFVSDMFLYLRRPNPESPLSDVFEKVGNTLEGEHAALMESEHGAAISDEVADFWDNLFHPEIMQPDAAVDPLSMQAVTPGGGVETKQFQWESDADFARRDRQYGEAREAVSVAKSKARHYEKLEAKVHATSQKMLASFNTTPNKLEAEAAKIGAQADTILARLGRELGDPATGQVSTEWRPAWEAFQGLAEEAKTNPMLADMLDDIPATFQEVLKRAAERGFVPTHIPELTWDTAVKKMFGHVSFGSKGNVDTAEVSGGRKVRTGMLSHHGLADRSIEAFAAGMVDATDELYKNEVVTWIEKNYARDHLPAQRVPQGWKAWDGDRAAIFSGEKFGVEGKLAPSATKIIPENVSRALRSMSNPYDHWVFHALTRNPAFKVWRTLLLTLSPKWYVNNVFGNIMLATAEGVSLKDWSVAVKQWRKGDIPLDVPTNNSILSIIEDGEGQGLVNRPLREALGAEDAKKVKLIKETVKHKLVRINESVDEIARAAVYEKTLRSTGSREIALTRAHVAMVDYNDLTPVERGAVRAMVPFYAWQKGVFKLLTRFPADHALATEVALMAGRVHEEMLRDRLHGPIPDAYLGLEQSPLNPDTLLNTRSTNPFLDAIQLLSPRGIAQSLNPFVDALVRDAYAAPEYGTKQKRIGPTGSPESGVDYSSALGQQLLSFPQVRLGQNLLGQPDVYGKQPTDLEAITQALGGVRTMSPEDIAAIRERLGKAVTSNYTG